MQQMKTVIVSIVIPTYSRNDTLLRAISSALAQTYHNIEIIVIDDNPADSPWRASTAELMQQYADDPRVRYLQNAHNLGGAGSRNEGIRAARGEYIAFLDDDDEYLPQNVEKKLEAFMSSDNPKLALAYGYCEYVNHGKVVYTERINHNGCCLYEAMKENCIAATSQWMVRKSAIVDAGMFPIVPSKQDSQTILRLLKAGYELQCVPEVLSRYYMDMDQFTHISNNGRKPLEGELLYYEECKKLYDRLTEPQIKQVEYTFSVMLYEKYSMVKDNENAESCWKKMFQYDTGRAAKYFAKAKLRQIKSRIFNH